MEPGEVEPLRDCAVAERAEVADVVVQYSLCGDAADASAWRIAVLREPDGRGGSAYVHDTLHVGDRVMVRGPQNHFELDPAPRYLFIAGAIGFTPILPMVALTAPAGVDWELLYGGRRRDSTAFLDEACGPRRPRSSAPAGRARPARPRRRAGRRGRGPLVLLPGAADAHDDAPFEDVLDQSVLTLVIRAGQVDPGSGPRGRHRCPLLVHRGDLRHLRDRGAGRDPDHHDAVLSAEACGYDDVMMICVSRSRTPQLVLDL